MRIDNVADVLVKEFDQLPTDRLSVRIACRTAEWPTGLESQLKRLWGEASVRALELAPLRRADVTEAATGSGVGIKEFMEELERVEAVPLAIKPVTLNFLLNTYQRRGAFPTSRADLYAEGCRLLCEEVSPSRRDAKRHGDLSAEKRLAVAARIAAITIFCNRYAIWTAADRGDVPTEDIRLEDLTGGIENTKNGSVEISAKAIRETLGTGLFSSRGPDRIGWAHQTYAEYLAAWFLVERGLSADQMMPAILHTDGKIVPQLSEAASWLASMTPEVFRRIIAEDPEVLLRSDAANADPNDRADLVKSILLLCENGEFVDHVFGPQRMYHKLNHPELENQLRPYIGAKKQDFMVRRVAIDIAEACGMQSLQEDLVQVALDETDSYPTRIQAAFAISKIGEDRAKQALRPLAMGLAGDDLDDELKGCGLACTWPHFLKPEELFAALTLPKQPLLFGAYERFLHGDIVDHLQPSDLPDALKWLSDQQASVSSSQLAVFADALLAKGLDNLDTSEVRLALGPAARIWFDIENRGPSRQDANAFRTALSSDIEKRRKLIEAMLPSLAEANDRIFLIYPGALVDSNDLSWLIHRLYEAKTVSLQRILAAVVARVFDQRDVSQVDAVICASRESGVLARELSLLLGAVDLDSPEAEAMRAEFRMIKESEAKCAERAPLEPPPDRRIAALLDKSEAGDTDEFWQLSLNLTLKPDSTHYGTMLEPDLKVLPGWKRSDADTKARIITAAKRYLVAFVPETDKWLGTPSITYAAIAGYQALLLLLTEAPAFVSNLSEAVWDKWAPVPLVYPHETDERWQSLTNQAYEKAPGTFLITLDRLVDSESGTGPVFIIRRVESLWDDRLAAHLLDKISKSGLTPAAFGAVLAELIRHHVAGAEESAASAIGTSPPSGGDERQRAIVAAHELLLHARGAGWEIVWPAVKRDTQFGLDVVSDLAYGFEQRDAGVARRLTETQLTELYIWLVRWVPYAGNSPDGTNDWKSRVLKRCWAVRDRVEQFFLTVLSKLHLFQKKRPSPSFRPTEGLEELRNGLLRELTARGTQEACDGIALAMKMHPSLDWLKWELVEAKKLARQRSWVPIPPEGFLELVDESTQSRETLWEGSWIKAALAPLKKYPIAYKVASLSFKAIGYLLALMAAILTTIGTWEWLTSIWP